MTTATKYYQAKNTEARLHGGPIKCPESWHVLDRTDYGYRCAPCEWDWSHEGAIIKKGSS